MRDVTALARRFKVDINTGTAGTPVWTTLMGILELAPPKVDPVIQKSADYDDEGWGGNQVTGNDWSMEATVRRKLSAAGMYDPGQEYLRSRKGKTGADALAQMRCYERDGGVEAYSGWAVIGWEDDKGKPEDTASAKISFTGDGPLLDIANPAA